MATTTAVTIAVCRAYLLQYKSNPMQAAYLPKNNLGGFNSTITDDAVNQMEDIVTGGHDGYVNGAAANCFMTGGVFST